MSTSTKNHSRHAQIANWLKQVLATDDFSYELASNDASFRRYFRVSVDHKTFILMDAPPAQEDTKPFVKVANFLGNHHINVPKITAYEAEMGFLLLTDFGNQTYLAELNQHTADGLYKKALDSLIAMQLTKDIKIPSYDKALLLEELQLFPDWFLGKHLAITTPKFLQEIFSLLINNAIEQPQVFVHRDYHSRNLMHTSSHSPGIIDFQDAVMGPITYDLVSLLRDCYIEWSDEQLTQWLSYYYAQATKQKLLNHVSFELFVQWFDWMGLQRHLKVLGIFCRLNYRDNKPNYMNDLTLTLNYVRKVSAKYPDFKQLDCFLKQQPQIAAIQ